MLQRFPFVFFWWEAAWHRGPALVGGGSSEAPPAVGGRLPGGLHPVLRVCAAAEPAGAERLFAKEDSGAVAVMRGSFQSEHHLPVFFAGFFSLLNKQCGETTCEGPKRVLLPKQVQHWLFMKGVVPNFAMKCEEANEFWCAVDTP